MKCKVFIDGHEGTTGLRIFDRLKDTVGIELLMLSDADRKKPEKRREMLNESDLTFLCLPDEAAKETVSFAERDGVKIIDASTAHRTSAEWAYGFPELSEEHRRHIKGKNRVSVPGCHASGFVALVYPLIKRGLLNKSTALSVLSVTGYSGGGKKMISEYESAVRDKQLDSPRIYATAQAHKHLPEMTSQTGLLNAPVFVPVVADYYCGMVTSIPLHKDILSVSPQQIEELYHEFYDNNGVMEVLKYTGENSYIAGNLLSGSDKMQIRIEGDEERMVLTACFDNLGKGASGAAVQCMNLMLGKNEIEGLNI